MLIILVQVLFRLERCGERSRRGDVLRTHRHSLVAFKSLDNHQEQRAAGGYQLPEKRSAQRPGKYLTLGRFSCTVVVLKVPLISPERQ